MTATTRFRDFRPEAGPGIAISKDGKVHQTPILARMGLRSNMCPFYSKGGLS